MPRGRKRTTGKYQTVEELEDMVQCFWKTQSEAQVARTCGVSPTTVKNILERVKRRGKAIISGDAKVSENAKAKGEL